MPGLGQRAQHPFEPRRTLVPPVAEQFGVERRDDVGRPADPLRLRGQPAPHRVDEVGDVDVDGAIGALGLIRRLLLRRHRASGDAGRLEPGEVVVGVEVAVGGMPRVARLRRPHAVAHLQVAAEGDDVGAADRAAERGVAVQRWAVDHEVRDARGGVIAFQSRVRRRTPVPRCRRGRARIAGRRRRGPRAGRTPAVAGAAAAGRDGPAGRRAVRSSRRRSARAAGGCRRGARPPRSRRAPARPRPVHECRRRAGPPEPSSRRPSTPRRTAASWPRSCQFASQWCMPSRQYGSSSWAVTTGVMPRVSR